MVFSCLPALRNDARAATVATVHRFIEGDQVVIAIARRSTGNRPSSYSSKARLRRSALAGQMNQAFLCVASAPDTKQ